MSEHQTDESVEPKDRLICHTCIGEEFLREQVRRDGEVDTCSYCAASTQTILISDLAEQVHEALEEHYERPYSDPGYGWGTPGMPVSDVIAHLAVVDDNVAEDLRETLDDLYPFDDDDGDGDGDGPYGFGAYYRESETSDLSYLAAWEALQKSLKGETRYFNKLAEEELANIFRGLGTARTADGTSVLRTWGPGQEVSSVFRARVFQSVAKLAGALESPHTEISAPPSKAAIAGRMNARGISVFYGATTETTAVAEVRPPVGCWVVTAEFHLIREISLLDVAALASLHVEGSLFDPHFKSELERAKFLKHLSRRITMPVMPDDEAADYLITQAMADYLSGLIEPQIDGILYSSSQTSDDGANLVLFHRTARTEAVAVSSAVKHKARISCQLHNEEPTIFGTQYAVTSEKPRVEPSVLSAENDWFKLASMQSMRDGDRRPVTLRMLLETLKVHEVKPSKICTTAFPVLQLDFDS